MYKLDHSSGHNAEQPDGLSTTASVIHLGWGGKQRKMRSSKLTIDDVGTLEQEQRILPGSIQSMVFTADDHPPIQDENTPKYDAPLGDESVTRKLTKAELKSVLETSKMNSDGNVEKLRVRATLANIPIIETKGKIIEGYVNKAKGAAQILCEREFIDTSSRLPDGSKLSMNGITVEDPVTAVASSNKATSAIEMLRK